MKISYIANWYNTATRQQQEIPPQAAPLLVYSCGPTMYSPATLGNHRTNIMYDLATRGLVWLGYEVQWAMNYTDVGHLTSDADEGDDKLAAQAKKERTTAWQIATQTIASFERDLDALHIHRPTQTLRATDHIAEMIQLVTELESRGYTYQTSDGIYYDTSKFSTYGALAKLDIKGLQEGARVEKNPEKRHPTDFALWKFSPKDQARDMEWDSPWGKGFPGWHIECSAMSLAALGPTLDLHMGGVDLLPIHHTNEVAQSEAATGKPFVKHWLHGEHLLIDGGRMGKSVGNAYTVADLVQKGFSPLDFRYLTLLTHYRKKLNFTWESLQAAAVARHRLQPLLSAPTTAKPNVEVVEKWQERIADDLDLPGLIALLWDYVGGTDAAAVQAATVQAVNTAILDLTDDPSTAGEIPEAVTKLAAQRETARQGGDYDTADQLRVQIEQAGYIIEDTPAGPTLKQAK